MGLGLEVVLETYEIRIIKQGHGPFIYACPQASDHAAIRRARSLAAAEDKIEVWRGLDCIYATPLERRLAG